MVEHRLVGSTDRESFMDGNGTQQNRRPLAQIESDLIKAETAFADADARLKEAERERRAALTEIDKHQIELDTAIADLRQRCTPGSKWHGEIEGKEGPLILQPEDIDRVADDPILRIAPSTAVANEFDRLKSVVRSRGSGVG